MSGATWQSTDAPSKVEQARELSANALDSLTKQLESGNSEQLNAYINAMSRFHKYSFGNMMLILAQRPDATHTAGFHTWRSLGRTVKRGEKGIFIIAPMILKSKDSTDDDKAFARFKAVHIFDISQTEGDPLPEPSSVGGDPGQALNALEASITKSGITLETSDDLGGAEGISKGGSIILRSGQHPAERFSTLVHEWTHEILHQVKKKEDRPNKTIRETEAEAVAFVVGHAIGLEVGTASADYIKLYQGDAETLSASLHRIQKTACTIIEAINTHDGNDGSSQNRNDNTPKPPVTPVANETPVAKPEIEVHELEPDRFAPGEFCYRKERVVGEGDIALSYSADKIAESNTVRSPFTWKGQQWIMTCGRLDGIQAYRLVHPDAYPRKATTYAKRTRQDGGATARHDPNGFYDGMTVNRGKQELILCGPPVKLVPGKAAQTSMFGDATAETQTALIEANQRMR